MKIFGYFLNAMLLPIVAYFLASKVVPDHFGSPYPYTGNDSAIHSKWVLLATILMAVAINIVLAFTFNYGISAVGYVKKLVIYCAVTVIGALLMFWGIAALWGSGGHNSFG